MKMLTEAEYAALMERVAVADQAMADTSLHVMARTLVAEAERRGQVLTITQHSTPPYAMGRYETVVEIRAARGAA